ncbi:hypothetical protein PDUR_11845 [Paenibacillus durus]|uniref:Nitrogenase/oxidoreductase component 1 domain-containing protein n=1 Tax=Paenibacillus durus TaxID=44251 RepID=A0A089HP68_PAEDU|nr:hypothetical protein PDUR_11845 [Paenibacillus durus]
MSFSQCAGCAAPAICTVLAMIRDTAVIIHSPAGCAASFADFNRKYKGMLRRKGLPSRNAPLISTNLTEMDMVFGAEPKLEEAIKEAIRRFAPKAVFIAASCGSGISGLDIQDVIDRVQGNFGVPITTVVCELYAPKKWGSGFGGKEHGLLTKVIKPPEAGLENPSFYNVIDFSEDDSIKKLLHETGIRWNYVAYGAEYETLERMGGALATFHLHADRFGSYLAGKLQEDYQVPNVSLPLPAGFAGTEACLRKIGEAVGRKSEFAALITRERSRYTERLSKLKERLKGIRCLPIVEGLDYESGILSILRELNVEIAGESGEKYCAARPAPVKGKQASRRPVHSSDSLYGPEGLRIGFYQGYELLPLVRLVSPDVLVVKHRSLAAWGVRLGIPCLWLDEDAAFYGYEGLLRFGERLADLAGNPHHARRMAAHTQLPYSEWWMELKLFWEVGRHG